jgi:hypothetical protein
MTLQIEREFWVSVRDSSRPEDIRAYLDKYPNGSFAALAKNRLDALVRPTRAAAPEPAPAIRNPQPELTAAAPPPAEKAVEKPTEKPVEKPAEKPVVVAATPPSLAATRSAAPAAAAPQTSALPAPAPATATARPDPIPGREIAPGVRELTFADGSTYRGAMRGASLHGKGEYVSKAFKYEGEFIDGLKRTATVTRATSRATARMAAASTSSPTATRTKAR